MAGLLPSKVKGPDTPAGPRGASSDGDQDNERAVHQAEHLDCDHGDPVPEINSTSRTMNADQDGGSRSSSAGIPRTRIRSPQEARKGSVDVRWM